jgi:SAM-dependent methyltransferase
VTTSAYAHYSRWKGWNAERFGSATPIDAAYFATELRRAGVSDLAGMTVLEFGYGNGAFANWATQRGAHYIGTELISDLLEQGRRAGLEVHDAGVPLGSTLRDASIDLAAAFDVFEHMDREQLAELLTALRRALKPGGLLIARCPSGDSPFSRAIQNGDLTHRIVLGSSAVRQLAQEASLEVVDIREPAFPLRGLGLATMSRRVMVLLARRLVYPIVTRAFMGGGRPVLTPNLVLVLRRS